jgi:hypothetical protein
VRNLPEALSLFAFVDLLRFIFQALLHKQRRAGMFRSDRKTILRILRQILKQILKFPFDDLAFLLFKAALLVLFFVSLVKLVRGAL